MSSKKEEWTKIQKEAAALLKGKKNAAGNPVKPANVSKLASALRTGNNATRKNIVEKYIAANGLAGVAGAAGAAVAAAAAPAKVGAPKISQANAIAAKAALNAAVAEAGYTSKTTIAAASHYAALLKKGKIEEAEEFVKKAVSKAAEGAGVKAAAAAAKAAVKNTYSNEQVRNILARNLKKGVRPVNISKFKQEIAAGKSESNAVAAVGQMRKNAAAKSAATKKAGKNAAAAAAAAGAAGAALVAPAPKVAAALKANANPFNMFNNTRKKKGAAKNPFNNSPNLLNFPAKPAPGGNKNPFNNFGGGGRRSRRNRKSRRNTRRNRRN